MSVEFSELQGKILKEIINTGDEITFITVDGEIYRQFHGQDCCETVYVEDICGDLSDLIETPILLAEETVHNNGATIGPEKSSYKSFTWTFYKLSTIKGSVTIRWFGWSNGYYSESVGMVKL